MATDLQSVDEWTDDEIRRKLEELGSPVGPITQSTRKVVILKLKRLLQQKEDVGESSQCPSNIRYSSGEESHDEKLMISPTTTVRRVKRTSIECRDSHLSPNTSTNIRVDSQVSSDRKPRKTRSQTIVTSNNSETDSESDIDIISYDNTETLESHTLKLQKRVSFSQEPQNSSATSFRDKCDRSKTVICGDAISKYSPNKETATSEERTILARSEVSNYNTNSINASENSLNTRHYISQKPRYSRTSRIRSILSWCGKIIAVIFVITIVYFQFIEKYSYRDIWTLEVFESIENIYPICGQNNVDSSICIEDRYLMPALDVAQILIPRILNLTIAAYCDQFAEDTYGIPLMSDQDAMQYLKEKLPTRKSLYLERDLKNFKILVILNTHWEVQVVANGMTEMNKVLFYGQFAARYFSLPFNCQFKRIAYHIPNISIIGLLALSGGYVILLIVRYDKRRRDQHRRNVFRIINEILHMVSSRQRDGNNHNYITINQCKDILIRSHEEWDRQKEWKDAVEFIEKHEARVRTELRNVNGKHVKVWTWVPTTEPPLHTNS